jgi:hypothetical protein
MVATLGEWVMSFRTNLLIAAGRNCSTAFARIALSVVGAIALATTATATPVTVNNFSFELPDVSGGSVDSGTTPIPNWTVSVPGSAGVRDTTGTPSDGTQWGYISPFFDTDNFFIQRPDSDTATFSSNTTYTLTVDVAYNSFTPAGVYSVAIIDPSDNILNTGGSATLVSSDWTTVSVSYTTGPSSPLAGQALRIRLGALSTVSSQLYYDNVRLDAVPVPEPMSFGLFGLGSIGVFAARRRAKRSI